MDSKDTCYLCGNDPGICVAPKSEEWEDCAKTCITCQHHRCKQRNKCVKLYPHKAASKKRGDKKK